MEQKDLFGNIIQSNGKQKVVSGYRIYDAEQKRRTVRNDLPSLYPDLPEKKYDIIYCDPPWDYGGKMQFDKSGKKDVNRNWEKIFSSVLQTSSTLQLKQRI